MMELDEDALICDLAETYQIYDYRSLPVKLVATLAAGLRDDSRIKLRAAGSPVPLEAMLLAIIADRVEMFRYGFSEDASKKRNVPVSLVETLTGESKKSNKAMGFRTPGEFEAALARIRGA
jgi:hypothetical protein